MNTRNAFLLAAVAALALVGAYALYDREPSGTVTAQSTATVSPSAPSAPPSATSVPHDTVPAPPPATAEADATSDYDPEADDGTIAFKADANGHIVTDEKARLDLERLYALYSDEEREKKVEEVAASLPPSAQRQLGQLMEQYKNYQVAAYQAYPPGRELTSAEQGVSQIDGMHGLRVQYFGEQAANNMFGAEEKVARELYRLIENEKDPSLTMEEKAERAQQIYAEQHPPR